VYLLALLAWIGSEGQSAAAPIPTLPTPALEVEVDFGAGTDFANLVDLRIDATFSGFDAGETMRIQAASVVGAIHLNHELRRVVAGLFFPADPAQGPLTTAAFSLANAPPPDLSPIPTLDEIESHGLSLFFFFGAGAPGEAELVSLEVSGFGPGRIPVTVEATTSLDPVAVPEPATFVLLGASALTLVAHTRRRRRATPGCREVVAVPRVAAIPLAANATTPRRATSAAP
jgi:hypothetical protein